MVRAFDLVRKYVTLPPMAGGDVAFQVTTPSGLMMAERWTPKMIEERIAVLDQCKIWLLAARQAAASKKKGKKAKGRAR